MKTLIISEPALVTGNSLQEVQEGLEFLKNFTQRGDKLIYLTNRPSDCITPVGGYVSSSDGSISFKYIAEEKKKYGLKISISSSKAELHSEKLPYNYAVFGNGALIFDELDRIIYERYIENHVIEEVAKLLKINGYEDNLNPIFAQIANKSFVKYYKSNTGVLDKGDCTNIYGFQCYSPSNARKSIEVNQSLCRLLESSRLGLKAWVLNNMPCIYSASTLKENAIQWLINNQLINPNDMRLIIGEITDLGLARAYSDLTYAVESNAEDLKGVRIEKSLIKILEKL